MPCYQGSWLQKTAITKGNKGERFPGFFLKGKNVSLIMKNMSQKFNLFKENG